MSNIIGLYERLLKETDNLNNLTWENIAKKPQNIRVFRVLSGMGQREFAKFLETSQATISWLERGQSKQLSEINAKKFFKKISTLKLEVVPPSIFQKKLSVIRNRGKFHGNYAVEMAHKSAEKKVWKYSLDSRKPTLQEQKIKKVLELNGIEFETNAVFSFGKINIAVDFAIPNATNTKIVLEAKNLAKNYRKRSVMFELGFKALKFHSTKPELKVVAVIDGTLSLSERNFIEQEFDKVFDSTNLERLIIFIKEKLGWAG